VRVSSRACLFGAEGFLVARLEEERMRAFVLDSSVFRLAMSRSSLRALERRRALHLLFWRWLLLALEFEGREE